MPHPTTAPSATPAAAMDFDSRVPLAKQLYPFTHAVIDARAPELSTLRKVPVVFLSTLEGTIEPWVAGVREAIAEAADTLAAQLGIELVLIYPTVATSSDILHRASVHIAITGNPAAGALASFPNLRLVANMWAGVDTLMAADGPLLRDRSVTVVRMVDPLLTHCMTEWVVMHVLALHRDLHSYLAQQREHSWCRFPSGPATLVAATDRRVLVLGAGELGRAAMEAVARFGFRTVGWTRTPRSTPDARLAAAGVDLVCGPVGLDAALADAHIVVNLLPLTDETRGLFSGAVFARMRRGAALVNAGRGQTVCETDLIDALDNGLLSWAVLDVFENEPLPESSPLWTHPRVVATPHVAATPSPGSACRVVVDTIRRFLGGEKDLPGTVDLERGY
ncbi:hypothetical protein HK405_012153 [Cladochytrium tenue]|nr:hypothetical protein HK405_012153 [Cladochytrium tenue]